MIYVIDNGESYSPDVVLRRGARRFRRVVQRGLSSVGRGRGVSPVNERPRAPWPGVHAYPTRRGQRIVSTCSLKITR
jgi:hypothetical protein